MTRVIGIVGLGSIGRRHARCLHALGVPTVAALRSGSSAQSDHGLGFIREFYELQRFLDLRPAGVIISNPTSMHVETALPFLEHGIPVLLEKPLDRSVEEAVRLLPHQNMLRVAYCMRFHRLYLELERLLADEALGRVQKAGFTRGFYLPRWHPGKDYRSEYSARSDQGGGAVRTLSHELDMARHLFGPAFHATGAVDRVSELDIDVDDCAFLTCRTDRNIRLHFELDFLAPDNINRGEVTTSLGRLDFCLQENIIRFSGYDGSRRILYHEPELELDHMYLAQMEDFLDFLRTGTSRNASLGEAMDTLRLIEAVEDAPGRTP